VFSDGTNLASTRCVAKRVLPLSRLEGRWTVGSGLSATEVAARLVQYGPNDIVEQATHPWWGLARDTAKDPMIWFFGGTSVLYAATGQVVEAVTLLIAIGPLVMMDVFLHRRTQASTAGLKSRLAERSTVIREGTAAVISSIGIVPGDLVVVGSGEAFPADGIIVGGTNLQADESSLTGESSAVRKHLLSAPPPDGDERPIADEFWGLAGTRLLTGRASLLVAYTGPETIYGDICRSARSSSFANTPLQQAVRRLVSVLVAAALIACVILVAARLAQGHGWVDAVVSAVTLATAALPEEFPVILAFFLGVGVYRLAKKRALVRRAVSVENIGRVTTICSDKTGTMTEGALRLVHAFPSPGVTAAQLVVLASQASRRDHADPMDAAIIEKSDRDYAGATSLERLATFPFTETRKRETAIVRDAEGRRLAVTKGAVEVVLGMTYESASAQRRWMEQVAALAECGRKVIACASAPLREIDPPDLEPTTGYDIAGLLAFEDPVRPGVADAVAECRRAGIHTIMVTGDHPVTAAAVAKDIGLGGGAPTIISGDELEAAVARADCAGLGSVDVIARASPAQKLTLVRSLQRAGEIVAVTGDGVNDVPALQSADIGIAMGERGTRSAREVASIVLLEDNFATIVHAIAEGRQLFRNLQLSFEYVLLIHIPLVLTAALIPLLGYPLLYLPLHIIWLEMLIHPTALLAFQDVPADDGLRRQPPRTVARFFTRGEWIAVGTVGLMLTLAVAAGYLRAAASLEAPHGRAMAMAILALSSGGMTAALSRLRTTVSRVVVTSTVALSVLLIQTPALAAHIDVVPLHLDDWVLVALAASGAAAGAAIAARVGVTTSPRERLPRPVQHVAHHRPPRSSGGGVLTEDPVRK